MKGAPRRRQIFRNRHSGFLEHLIKCNKLVRGRINRQTGEVTLASTMVVIWMVRFACQYALRDESGHDKSERPGSFNLIPIFDIPILLSRLDCRIRPATKHFVSFGFHLSQVEPTGETDFDGISHC